MHFKIISQFLQTAHISKEIKVHHCISHFTRLYANNRNVSSTDCIYIFELCAFNESDAVGRVSMRRTTSRRCDSLANTENRRRFQLIYEPCSINQRDEISITTDVPAIDLVLLVIVFFFLYSSNKQPGKDVLGVIVYIYHNFCARKCV